MTQIKYSLYRTMNITLSVPHKSRKTRGWHGWLPLSSSLKRQSAVIWFHRHVKVHAWRTVHERCPVICEKYWLLKRQYVFQFSSLVPPKTCLLIVSRVELQGPVNSSKSVIVPLHRQSGAVRGSSHDVQLSITSLSLMAVSLRGSGPFFHLWGKSLH